MTLNSWPSCFYFPNARITQICHHAQLKFIFIFNIYLREVLYHGILVEIRGQFGGSWRSPPSLRIPVIELRSSDLGQLPYQLSHLSGPRFIFKWHSPPQKKVTENEFSFKHGSYKILSGNLSHKHTHTHLKSYENSVTGWGCRSTGGVLAWHFWGPCIKPRFSLQDDISRTWWPMPVTPTQTMDEVHPPLHKFKASLMWLCLSINK